MKKWEYKHIIDPNSLGKLGIDGWELVSAIPYKWEKASNNGGRVQDVLYILKREIV